MSRTDNLPNGQDRLNELEEELLDVEAENHELRQLVKHYEFERYKFREIQRLAKAGTWELNHLTYNLTLSDELSRLLCNNPEQLNDLSWQDFLDSIIVEHDTNVKKALFDNVIANGQSLDFEHFLTRADGQLIFVRHHCKTFYNPIGQPLITVGLIHDFTDEHNLQIELEKCSVTDELTRLYNRRRINSMLKEQHDILKRFGATSSYIMLDIDHFKLINDTHGHQVGDEVLNKIAKYIKGVIRSIDFAGRWGGEEFLIICPHTPLDPAALLAEKLREGIMRLKISVGITVTASFGVGEVSKDESTEALIKRVDDVLYEAKHRGRNKVMKSKPNPND